MRSRSGERGEATDSSASAASSAADMVAINNKDVGWNERSRVMRLL